MQINITGHHIDVTPALKKYVTTKFDKLERHFDNVLDVHVTLTVEKLRHQAEADLRLSGNRIHAEATDGDMYAAIDLLIDKLDRQIVKHKEKVQDKHASEAQRGRSEA